MPTESPLTDEEKEQVRKVIRNLGGFMPTGIIARLEKLEKSDTAKSARIDALEKRIEALESPQPVVKPKRLFRL